MENSYVGPFLIVKKLGSRRQKVYLARQTEQDRDVALKFISFPPSIEWTTALEKIEREVKELQKLQHPNLVKVYGAGVDDERIFFATELIDGEALSSILSRRGKLAPDLVVEYGRQIAEFLRYLHSKDLIHSKLNPEKILVTSDHRLKITDLRLNRSKRRRWDTTRQHKLEIAAYMAPEQYTEGATQKSDFYALGVILFEMLTGKLPYEPDTVKRMTKMKMNAPVPSVATCVMNCPIWLDKIVSQMLSPDPRTRPHSARAIAMAFEEIKNIDATQQAAVTQLTGGFNPLTAGQDKTEARRLLGYKKPKRKKDDDTLFFQRVPFQIGALLLIVAITVYFLIPPSAEQIIEDAGVMVRSNDPDLWDEARYKLQPIMDGGGEYAAAAEKLYYLSRRQSLVLNAENGLIHRLQNENVQEFGKAVLLQQDGHNAEASEIYSQLVAEVDPDGNNRHVYHESKSRLASLSQREDLPTDISELSDLIAIARDASTPGQLQAAHNRLARIVIEFAGEDGYETIVAIAAEQLQIIKRKIANGDQPEAKTAIVVEEEN